MGARLLLRQDRLPLSLLSPQSLPREVLERGSCIAEAVERVNVTAGESPPLADNRRPEGLQRSGSVEAWDVGADAELVAWVVGR